MKTKRSLTGSVESALKKAQIVSRELTAHINCLEDSNMESAMPRVRSLLNELNQRVHEYNAYRNCLETE